MPDQKMSVPVLFPGGLNVQDQDFYSRVPDFSQVNVWVGKAPGPNTFRQFTAVAGLAAAGYLTMVTDGNVQVAVPLLDHPLGPTPLA